MASKRVSLLLRFDFASATGRYWLGFGRLRTLDGHEWIGCGKAASIGEITSPKDGSAPEQTFTLSGVDAGFIAIAQGSQAEYVNRMCFVQTQEFDAAWQPVGLPHTAWWGRMHHISVTQQASEEGFTRSVVLSAESVFGNRRRPRHGYLTDRDQQGRFLGDRGCERVLGMRAKTIVFPDY